MKGLLIACGVTGLWFAHLLYSFFYLPSPSAGTFVSPAQILWMLFHVLLQTWLFTGLFITAHDAMHGTVAPGRKKVNYLTGMTATFLFAALSYRKLLEKHHLHHKYPGTEQDPDYHTGSQNFWAWWVSFMKQYVTLWQLLIMAVLFNLLNIWFSASALIIYWILPSILSTLQLFYFGTYLPHRLPHTEAMTGHHARTQKKNHLWALLSCYFFGYHLEHHLWPGTPWWRLYTKKAP